MCDAKPWQIATKKHLATQKHAQDKNLRRRCCMCDAKLWQIATKKHGNSDENLCQDQTYDVDVVCATKNRGKLRRTFVSIATVVQNKNWLPTNYRRYCDVSFKFKKKKYTRYGITILHCNMVYHITM
jgi:hypothetical protein